MDTLSITINSAILLAALFVAFESFSELSHSLAKNATGAPTWID